jgi:hypothetical protein
MTSFNDRDKVIIRILDGKLLTTLELEVILNIEGTQCPDDLVRTLNVMRRKGLIKGEVSTERGGWVWWVENKTE